MVSHSVERLPTKERDQDTAARVESTCKRTTHPELTGDWKGPHCLLKSRCPDVVLIVVGSLGEPITNQNVMHPYPLTPPFSLPDPRTSCRALRSASLFLSTTPTGDISVYPTNVLRVFPWKYQCSALDRAGDPPPSYIIHLVYIIYRLGWGRLATTL